MAIFASVAKVVRPSSAVVRSGDAATRPGNVDTLLVGSTLKQQQNGTMDVGRHTTGGLSDSIGGPHRVLLYVLGEKMQMKVIVNCYAVPILLCLELLGQGGGSRCRGLLNSRAEIFFVIFGDVLMEDQL